MTPIPRKHRLKTCFWIGLILLVAVHLLYVFLAYRHLSLGQFLSMGIALLCFMLVLYGIIAYLILPRLWKRYYRHQPQVAGTPKITHTEEGIPGDPLNIGLVGSENEVIQAMLVAQWSPADPASLQTVVGIAKSLVFHHPDPKAPVSNLYIEGRKQDLSFERPEGDSVKQRHHVRFWRTEGHEIDGRTFWIGATTFDKSLRISRYTGQLLHRIDPEIDAERDKLIGDLSSAGVVGSSFQAPGVGVTLNGRNGEGDWYYTDGQVVVAVLSSGGL